MKTCNKYTTPQHCYTLATLALSLIITVILSSCVCDNYNATVMEKRITAAILRAHDVGCVKINDVTYTATAYGNFILCEEEEYFRRVGE